MSGMRGGGEIVLTWEGEMNGVLLGYPLLTCEFVEEPGYPPKE